MGVLTLRRAASRAERGAPSPLVARVIAAGQEEAQFPVIDEPPSERRVRIAAAMRRRTREIIDREQTGLTNLAVISSVAPFVGLLGTVWGIMTSFIGIASAKDTSLAVVAPGIAEALAATAVGLAAAIPAAFAYNRLAAAFSASGRRMFNIAEENAFRISAGAANAGKPGDAVGRAEREGTLS
jgi:biopolymer transport protein ExbB/TolQ